MEILEYCLIIWAPGFTISTVCLLIYFICKPEVTLRELVDFIAFNVFPEILTTKTDDNNQTVVYLTKANKVLLQGDAHKKATRALCLIAFNLITYAFDVVCFIAFIEITHDCEAAKDCFLLNPPSNSSASAMDFRANCSDPEILQGKTPVLCYRLVFRFELAVGITYGMYKVCKKLLSIGETWIMKLNKSQFKRLKIVYALLYLLITIIFIVAVIVVFKLYSHWLSVDIYKTIFNFTIGMTTTFLFIFLMPWENIIEQNSNGSSEEEETRNSSEISDRSVNAQSRGTRERSRAMYARESGFDNPVNQ